MACQFDSRIPELTRNLLQLYRHRTPEDESSGMAWYPQAHRIVIEWSNNYGYSISTVACVIAAISPQCEWKRNLIIADDILAGKPPSIGGALHSCIRKAQAIRDARATDTILYMPYGPKVRSFACNLAGDYSIVTVDTHACQAALADVESTVILKWRPYVVFAECYRRAAGKANIEPAHFQAILWHIWKRLYPRTDKIQRRRQWHVITTED